MTSRKLAATIAALLAIVGTVIGCEVVGDVAIQVQLTAIVLEAGLGGYSVKRQADIDVEQPRVYNGDTDTITRL